MALSNGVEGSLKVIIIYIYILGCGGEIVVKWSWIMGTIIIIIIIVSCIGFNLIKYIKK